MTSLKKFDEKICKKDLLLLYYYQLLPLNVPAMEFFEPLMVLGASIFSLKHELPLKSLMDDL